MDTIDRDGMRKVFETWNSETLLDELVQRGDDLVPEAREEIAAVLASRGVSEAAVELDREAYRAHLAERALPLEELVTIETFDDRLSAEEAGDLLRQNGIECAVLGSDTILFGPGLLSIGPRPLTLKVAAHEADAAKTLLAEFAPAAIDRGTDDEVEFDAAAEPESDDE